MYVLLTYIIFYFGLFLYSHDINDLLKHMAISKSMGIMNTSRFLNEMHYLMEWMPHVIVTLIEVVL